MKRIVEEDGKSPFIDLLDQRCTFFCANYIYTGKLIGVNETCILLTDLSIVYETGSFSEKHWKDAQPLPNNWYIMIEAIESFGILK